MRITFLTASESWGGTELHTLAVARQLVERGHAVHLVQLGHELYARHGGALLPTDVVLQQLPRGRDLERADWERLLATDAGIVVHVKGGFGLSWPLLDRVAMRRRRVMHRIEHLVPLQRTWRQRLSPRAVLRARWHREAAARILAITEIGLERLVRDHGYDRSRIAVITNGIDTQRFQFDGVQRDAMRRNLGIGVDDFVFGTVTRLAPVKRIDRMLRAFAALPAGPQHTRLVIAGDGPDQAELRSLAGQLGIDGRCHWLGSSTQVVPILAGLDAFLLTSRTESVSYALLEAMAMERPVVAMSVDGVPLVMRDQVYGRLTDVSEATFSAAMAEVRAWSADRRALAGAAARAHVVKHHDGQRQAALVADWVLEGGA